MPRKKLGEMLVEAGVLSDQGLRRALNEQKRWGRTLGHTLVDMKLVSEAELVGVLSVQLNLPTVDLDAVDIHPTVLELVPGELAEQFNIMPFAQPMKFLDVAMLDPTNLGIVDELRIRTQLNIRPYLAGDGGWLEVLELENDTLKIRYEGACGSCPSSLTGTLMAIENMIKEEIDPQITVLAV